jgi:hypothetical protein
VGTGVFLSNAEGVAETTEPDSTQLRMSSVLSAIRHWAGSTSALRKKHKNTRKVSCDKRSS